jgi:hypothetical protein
MSKRHQTYDKIRRLLSDGGWHDARELESITRYVHAWVAELRHDPDVEISDDQGHVRLRFSAPRMVS